MRCRDAQVTRTLSHAVAVEPLPGVEGLVHEKDLDIGLMKPSMWRPGDLMDVKLVHVSHCFNSHNSISTHHLASAVRDANAPRTDSATLCRLNKVRENASMSTV
jgi:hypothetical protein